MKYTYTVTTEADDNSAGSLRSVVNLVNNEIKIGTVLVGFADNVNRVVLTQGALNITHGIELTGRNNIITPSASSTPALGAQPSSVVISGNGSDGIFNISGNDRTTNNSYLYDITLTNSGGNTPTVNISNNCNFTVKNCNIVNNHPTGSIGLFNVSNNSYLGFGNCTLSDNTLQTVASIASPTFFGSNASSTLGFQSSLFNHNTLTNTTSNDNFAGSMVFANGILNILLSDFSNNTIRNNNGASGSIVSVNQVNTNTFVRDSTFADNVANNVLNTSSVNLTLAIQGSTFSNNSTNVVVTGGAAKIVNSTFAYNTTAVNLNGSRNDASSIINCTIVDNNIGVILRPNSETFPLTVVGNTIIALNNTDVVGIVNSAGGNFIGAANGTNGFNSTDQVGSTTGSTSTGPSARLDPRLNPLNNYGGSTQTFTPMLNSPVVNKGINANVTAYRLMSDQRGETRIIDGTVDVGSVELQRVCLAGDSKVLVKNKHNNQMAEIPIKEVYANIHLVYSVLTQSFVPLLHNIISGTATQFVEVKLDSLGVNIPNQTLHLTSGHVVKIDDQYLKAIHIPHSTKIKLTSQKIYTLCTEQKNVVKVANMDVTTYGVNQWNEYALRKGISWIDNKEPNS